MQYRERWLAAVFVGAGLFAATASPQAAEPIDNPPSKVTPIEGTTFSRVTLTPEAAARLGIEITQVRDIEMVRKRIVSGLVLVSPEAVATTGGLGFLLGAVFFTGGGGKFAATSAGWGSGTAPSTSWSSKPSGS